MNKKDYTFHNETDTWQTGRTQPPKHHNGLIAFLLVLVILLSGISTALSIMNFKLYRKLSIVERNTSLSFSRSSEIPETTEAVHEEVQVLQAHLGISGSVIPSVYQRFYQLPNGVYVSRIADKSEAQEKGLVVGDIITSINGNPIRDAASVEFLAESLLPGDSVELTLSRAGSEISVTLNWNE